MLSDLIRTIAFQILAEIGHEAGEAVRHGSPLSPRLQQLLEAYWDIVYIYRYGLPKIPEPKIEPPSPFLPQPQPDPAWMYGGLVRDSLLLDMLDFALGDPHPQPSSFIKLLGNNQIRITAVKNLLDHYQKAIPQLKAEAQRLEGLQ